MQSSQTSPILILDLVSKFLTKALEKDRNQSHYLKQWESFKSLLSATPLDLNPVLTHIATLTPLAPLPEPVSSSPGLSSRSPGLNSRSPGLGKPGLKARPNSITDQYALTKNRSFHVNTDRDPVVTSFQVSIEDSHSGLSYLEAEVPHKRTSSNAGVAINLTPNPVDLRRHTSHKPSTFANIGDTPSTGEPKSAPFSLEDMLNGSLGNVGLGGFSSAELKTNKSYHLGFLTSIAKQLKDGIDRRSDNMANAFSRAKQAKIFDPLAEPRSPLRKVKVYDKQQKDKQEFDLTKLLGGGSLGGGATYTSVNTTAGVKLDYLNRAKLY